MRVFLFAVCQANKHQAPISKPAQIPMKTSKESKSRKETASFCSLRTVHAAPEPAPWAGRLSPPCRARGEARRAARPGARAEGLLLPCCCSQGRIINVIPTLPGFPASSFQTNLRSAPPDSFDLPARALPSAGLPPPSRCCALEGCARAGSLAQGAGSRHRRAVGVGQRRLEACFHASPVWGSS